MGTFRHLGVSLTLAFAALAFSSPAGAQSQPAVSSADLSQLETTVADIRARVTTLRTTDPTLAADVERSLADLNDEVTYLRVKMRREGSVTREEFTSVRDRLETLRVRARGPAPAAPAASSRDSNIVIVPVGTQFDVRLQGQLNSGTATVEQRFEATTLVDYSEGTRVVIPAGSLVRGFVSSVRAAGRIDRRGSLTLSFDELRSRQPDLPLARRRDRGARRQDGGRHEARGRRLGGGGDYRRPLWRHSRSARRHPGRRRRYDCRDRGQRRRFADRHHSADPDRPATGDCGRTAVMRLERESPAVSDASLADWRQGLPVLRGDRVLLREPVLSDAPFLFRELCVPEVCEYVPPPPAAVDGIERMIAKGIERRQAGQVFSFAIQLADSGELAGILQFVSSRDHLSDAAIPAVWELGFALSARYWGAGLLGEAAALALGFAFQTASASTPWKPGSSPKIGAPTGRSRSLVALRCSSRTRRRRMAGLRISCSGRFGTPTARLPRAARQACRRSCLVAGASGTILSVTVRGCRRLR